MDKTGKIEKKSEIVTSAVEPSPIAVKRGTFSSATDKIRANPWILSTLVFGILAIILLLPFFGITGNSISENTAEQKISDFIASRGFDANISSIEEVSGLYLVKAEIGGQETELYLTKDGKNLVLSLIPLEIDDSSLSDSGASTAQEIPKSNKPKFEAFVFSYCPYGTQFEKAMLPVYKSLKSKIDFDIVFIGAMHGEYEKIESLRQICIEKEYGKDKLWNYLEKFLGDTNIGDCNGADSCVNPLIDKIFSQLSIDKNKISACMTNDAEALYNKDMARASALGISGSPGTAINGVEAQVGRSPDAVLKAVCSAFNTEPSECSQTTLSTQQASPGFGFGTGAATSSASCN